MGIILFSLACLAISVRLIWLWHKTRQLPELLLAISYVTAGTVGWTILLAGYVAAGDTAVLGESYQASSMLFTNIGVIFQYLFVWYVFRRDLAWSKAIVGVAVVMIVVSYSVDSVIHGSTFGQPIPLTTWLGIMARDFAYLWGAVEAGRGVVMMRRRARVGMGSPVVANRMFLWGTAMSMTFAIAVIATLGYGLALDSVAFGRAATPVYSALALVSAACMWLAFIPPQRYLRWVESRAGGNGDRHG